MTDEEQAAAVVNGLRDVEAWRYPDGDMWIYADGIGRWWRTDDGRNYTPGTSFQGRGNPEATQMKRVQVPEWFVGNE